MEFKSSKFTSESSVNVTSPPPWQEGNNLVWNVGAIIFLPVAILCGTVGNIMVLCVTFYRFPNSSVALFKQMLAIMDLVNILLAHTSLLYTALSRNEETDGPACKLTGYVACTTCCVTSSLFVVIAYDRYIKLGKLHMKGIEKDTIKSLFIGIVLVSALANLPALYLFGTETQFFPHYRVFVYSCFIEDKKEKSVLFFVHFALLGLLFLSIIVSLVFLYRRIAITLRQSASRHSFLFQLASPSSISLRSRRIYHTVQIFILVTVIFFLSYSPFFVVILLDLMAPSLFSEFGPLVKALTDLARLSPLTTNVANPIIYSFTSAEFRQEARRMLPALRLSIVRHMPSLSSLLYRSEETYTMSSQAPKWVARPLPPPAATELVISEETEIGTGVVSFNIPSHRVTTEESTYSVDSKS